MGAKLSEEMKQARKLLAKRVTPAEAARRAGVSRSAITRDAESSRIRAENPIVSKSEQAVNLMKSHGLTATEAARKVGITREAIYAFVNRRKNKGTEQHEQT